MRLFPGSLQGRMLALSAIATLVALAIAGVTIAGVLERFVMQGIDRRLDAEIALLASAVDGDGHVDRLRLGQRLGALERGHGWRWRIAGPDGALGTSDFPVLDAAPPPPGVADPDFAGKRDDQAHGPHPREGEERGVAVHARQLVIATRHGAVTLIAAAPRDVVRRPIRDAVAPLLATLAVLAGLLTGAMLVQLRIGLRPLRRLRDEVAAIRSDRRARVSEDQPDELRPLAAELNALAADNEAALAAARSSAANLSHALKTPIATLAIDVRDQPALAAQVRRVEDTIRHHLARARTMVANDRATTGLKPAIDGVMVALRHLHADRAVAIDVGDVGEVTVAIDPHDLDELLGNLLDNAVRYAATRVNVSASRTGRLVELVIRDDGPGIDAADRLRILQPGVRLDERTDGHGFGLTIASQLVSLYGGTMSLDDAEGGGLCVRLLLPPGNDDACPRRRKRAVDSHIDVPE